MPSAICSNTTPVSSPPGQAGSLDKVSSDDSFSVASGSGAPAVTAADFGPGPGNGIGANQKTGYRRCRLFNSKAQTSSNIDDNKTMGKKYHDRCQIWSSVAGSRAVAPAGGCVVPVNCMATMASAVDSEAASQRSDSKRAWSGNRLNNFVTQMPIRALKKWPKIRARGWARGASIAPKTRTADAPWLIVVRA